MIDCCILQVRGRVRPQAVLETKQAEEDVQIEGLSSNYCDDFVCTSSPAVEQTVRALARDLCRQSWTASLFTRDVTYSVSRQHSVCCELIWAYLTA
jgi:hypothetical protein